MSDRPGIVYVVENRVWPTWLKIGRAEGQKGEAEGAMRRRIYQYNTGDPLRGYQVVAHDWAACCHTAETYAHSMLFTCFKRGNGEWFQGSRTLAEDIVKRACHVGRLAPHARLDRFKQLFDELKQELRDDAEKIFEDIADSIAAPQPSKLDPAAVVDTARAAHQIIGLLLEITEPNENLTAAAKAVQRRLDALESAKEIQ